ncbi:MAG: hypothetical protein ABSG69_05255, partial [Candidatus Acidiferrum sp.]
MLEFLPRKLGLLSVNILNYPQTASQQYIEPSCRALLKKPFSWLEPHIGDSLRQASAFGFVKTGKNSCLSQLFCNEHVPRSASLGVIVTLYLPQDAVDESSAY